MKSGYLTAEREEVGPETQLQGLSRLVLKVRVPICRMIKVSKSRSTESLTVEKFCIVVLGELIVDTEARAELAAGFTVIVIAAPYGEAEVVQDIPYIFQIRGIDVFFPVGEYPFIRLVLDRGKGNEHIRVECSQEIRLSFVIIDFLYLEGDPAYDGVGVHDLVCGLGFSAHTAVFHFSFIKSVFRCNHRPDRGGVIIKEPLGNI